MTRAHSERVNRELKSRIPNILNHRPKDRLWKAVFGSDYWKAAAARAED
jgi:hypothetical protein